MSRVHLGVGGLGLGRAGKPSWPGARRSSWTQYLRGEAGRGGCVGGREWPHGRVMTIKRDAGNKRTESKSVLRTRQSPCELHGVLGGGLVGLGWGLRRSANGRQSAGVPHR